MYFYVFSISKSLRGMKTFGKFWLRMAMKSIENVPGWRWLITHSLKRWMNLKILLFFVRQLKAYGLFANLVGAVWGKRVKISSQSSKLQKLLVLSKFILLGICCPGGLGWSAWLVGRRRQSCSFLPGYFIATLLSRKKMKKSCFHFLWRKMLNHWAQVHPLSNEELRDAFELGSQFSSHSIFLSSVLWVKVFLSLLLTFQLCKFFADVTICTDWNFGLCSSKVSVGREVSF